VNCIASCRSAPAEAIIDVPITNGSERLVIETGQSERFAEIFLKCLKLPEIGGQRWLAPSVGELDEFHEAPIDKAPDLASRKNAPVRHSG